MNKRKFYIQLFSVAVALAAVIFFLQIFPAIKPAFHFLLISLGFFILLSLGMFLLAAGAAVSKDKNAFTRMLMVFTLGKLLLTVVLIIGYQMIVKPAEIYYVIPFFMIYISFTVFETYFLTKLGKIKSR